MGCVHDYMGVIPYLGVPFNLWVDKSKDFLSVQFITLANVLGCNIVPFAVAAHRSLITERYLNRPRVIVNKLIIDHLSASLTLIIDYANLAMSHTFEFEGFFSAIPAFGAQPCLPPGNHKQQPQSSLNRMDLMSTGRRAYEAVVCNPRVRLAMNTSSPDEHVPDFAAGDEVLLFREKKC